MNTIENSIASIHGGRENARLVFPDHPHVHLSVRTFAIDEAFNQPFSIRLECVSSAEDVDLSALVGARAAFELSASTERVWRGLCEWAQFVRVASDKEGLASYEILLAPTIFRLRDRIHNRLFQHVSIPNIVRHILDEWSVEHEWRIEEKRYPPLELRTQYGESDLAFVSRLLEEAGIAYWFEDAGTKESRLVLGDRPHQNPLRPGGALAFVDDVSLARSARSEHITRVRLEERSRPGKVTVRDYDFLRPRHALFTSEAASRDVEHAHEQYLFRPGFGLAEDPSMVGKYSATPLADELGVARRREEFAQERARRMLDAARGNHRVVTYEASIADLSPGVVFRMDGHPRPDLTIEQSLLVVRQRVRGEIASPNAWRFEGAAVFASVPFRPAQITPKPRMYGLQTAVVVDPDDYGASGPSKVPGGVGTVEPLALEGSLSPDVLTNNTVYVDEHGRVRVQFPWDRDHAFDKQSSLWIRVSQGWAGSGYGLFTIPRVGHEVLVAFLDGDPDCPIIVGRVHNVAQPPPYPLPAAGTVSTWKTSSSPIPNGSNELRFEDANGREHVYLQAQKDMDQLVKSDFKQAIGHDSTRYVQANDTHTVGGTRTDFVNVNEARAVGLNQFDFVGVNRVSHVGVEQHTLAGTRWAATIARGLSSGLVTSLESLAGNVGNVARSAATTVLGGIPMTPLAVAADSALAGLGDQLFAGMKSLVDSKIGLETDPGPPPTSIEMVDRQIKLTTGEASIVLDGPNVTISAQGNIVLHALDHITVLAEDEIAIGAQKKMALVSSKDDVIVQAKNALHLNPFHDGANVPPIQRLDAAAPDVRDPKVCVICGGPLVEGDALRRSCAAMHEALPTERNARLPQHDDEDVSVSDTIASEATGMLVELGQHGFKGDLMEHAVDLIIRGIDAAAPSYDRVVEWMASLRQISEAERARLRAEDALDDAEYTGVYLGWWAERDEQPREMYWSFGPTQPPVPEALGNSELDLVVYLPGDVQVRFLDRMALQAIVVLMQMGRVPHA